MKVFSLCRARTDIPDQPLYDDVPSDGAKSAPIYVKNIDNMTIIVALIGSTSTAICTPEYSIDGGTWIPLSEQTQSITPTEKEAGYLFNSVPFEYIRMSFDTIVTPGDTFTVNMSGKGA